MLAGFFVLAGLNHFPNAAFYVRMMPPDLPWPLLLVYASGIAEIAFGVALLVSRLQALAAWGMIALLVAVFPANVHMALHPELFPEFRPELAMARLPLQGLLILWAYAYTGHRCRR